MSDTAFARSLGDLPTELLFKTVGFLPLKEQLRLEQTSKQFHSIITSTFSENIGLKLDIFGQKIIRGSKNEETFVHDLTLALHDKNGGICTTTEPSYDSVKEILRRFRNSIAEIETNFPIYFSNLRDQAIERLMNVLKQMGNFCFENVHSLKVSGLPVLKHKYKCLAGILLERGKSHEMDGKNLLESCPNLKKLNIGFLHCDRVEQSRHMDYLCLPRNIESLALYDTMLNSEQHKFHRLYDNIFTLGGSLKQVSLNGFYLSVFPVSYFLPSLANLTFLNLSNNTFTMDHGLESLKCLPLQRLYIECKNRFCQHLDFSFGTPISAWAAFDSKMRTTLEVLSLENLRNIPKCELQSIAKFEKLRALSLDCSGEEATPSALAAMFNACLTLECLRVYWEHNLDYYASLGEGCPALTLLDLVLTGENDFHVLFLETFAERCFATDPDRQPIKVYLNEDLFERAQQSFEHEKVTLVEGSLLSECPQNFPTLPPDIMKPDA